VEFGIKSKPVAPELQSLASSAAIQTVTVCGFRIADCGLRIVLIEKSFINWKSEIRNRQSAIKGYLCLPGE